MFFSSLDQVYRIAAGTHCAIFVTTELPPLDKYTRHLTPDQSKQTSIITVEQIRDFISLTQHRETTAQFYLIQPADAMNEAAQNAFLKTVEEPQANCHFMLFTTQPDLLLPTIRSRAQIFYLRQQNLLNQPPLADADILAWAKKLIAADSKQLPAIAAELAKVKTKPRENAKQIVATTIDLLYKSYFKTENPKFLAKLPHFIQLYDSLEHNGHLKLHLVADLC